MLPLTKRKRRKEKSQLASSLINVIKIFLERPELANRQTEHELICMYKTPFMEMTFARWKETTRASWTTRRIIHSVALKFIFRQVIIKRLTEATLGASSKRFIQRPPWIFIRGHRTSLVHWYLAHLYYNLQAEVSGIEDGLPAGERAERSNGEAMK